MNIIDQHTLGALLGGFSVGCMVWAALDYHFSIQRAYKQLCDKMAALPTRDAKGRFKSPTTEAKFDGAVARLQRLQLETEMRDARYH